MVGAEAVVAAVGSGALGAGGGGGAGASAAVGVGTDVVVLVVVLVTVDVVSGSALLIVASSSLSPICRKPPSLPFSKAERPR